MLFTKSILASKEANDGTRISVMARHTLEDGITPDVRINEESFDEWLVELAPPAKLVGDYYKRGLPWAEYEERYREFLASEHTASKVDYLASRALREDITLLCVEETADQCHRRLLAEACQDREPGLMVEHR